MKQTISDHSGIAKTTHAFFAFGQPRRTQLALISTLVILMSASSVAAQVSEEFRGTWTSASDTVLCRQEGLVDGAIKIDEKTFSFILGEGKTVCRISSFKLHRTGTATVTMGCEEPGLRYKQTMLWKIEKLEHKTLLILVYLRVVNIQGTAHRMPTVEPDTELAVKCNP